jgi:hypothetical protein
MADSQSTPQRTKPVVKPAQYEPTTSASQSTPARADGVDVPKADPTAATKTDKPAPSEKPTTGDKSAPANAHEATPAKADVPSPRLAALTLRIDPASAELISVEGLDSTGSRWVPSAEEKAALLQGGGRADRLAAVVERAFEAGIASVLGDEDEEDEEEEETPEDAEIRRTLLAPLMARGAARRLAERASLNRAIVGTLLEHSVQSSTP